jgi:hypothetical protein
VQQDYSDERQPDERQPEARISPKWREIRQPFR